MEFLGESDRGCGATTKICTSSLLARCLRGWLAGSSAGSLVARETSSTKTKLAQQARKRATRVAPCLSSTSTSTSMIVVRENGEWGGKGRAREVVSKYEE